MKQDRRKEIENYIAERQEVTMTELAEKFEVSMNTIRADVAYLVDSGAAIKVYGGVQSSMEKNVSFFSSRVARNNAVKKAIARDAAELISDGDIIYIDAGTTTMYITDYIPSRKKVTVITPNLYVITNVLNKPNINLLVLPGELDRRTNSLKGANTFKELSKYQIQKAFMGCTGIAEDYRISVSNYVECEIKKTAVQQSRKRYLLVDSGKFEESSLLSYGQLSQMSGVFSDRNMPKKAMRYCETMGIKLEIV